jgi:predicted nicotinamide N-methyase
VAGAAVVAAGAAVVAGAAVAAGAAVVAEAELPPDEALSALSDPQAPASSARLRTIDPSGKVRRSMELPFVGSASPPVFRNSKARKILYETTTMVAIRHQHKLGAV